MRPIVLGIVLNEGQGIVCITQQNRQNIPEHYATTTQKSPRLGPLIEPTLQNLCNPYVQPGSLQQL